MHAHRKGKQLFDWLGIPHILPFCFACKPFKVPSILPFLFCFRDSFMVLARSHISRLSTLYYNQRRPPRHTLPNPITACRGPRPTTGGRPPPPPSHGISHPPPGHLPSNFPMPSHDLSCDACSWAFQKGFWTTHPRGPTLASVADDAPQHGPHPLFSSGPTKRAGGAAGR